jgi:hypothetical protein
MKLIRILIWGIWIYCPQIYANPWLTPPGKTTVYIGGAVIDKTSKEQQTNIRNGYVMLKENIRVLEENKASILLQAKDENRPLLNSEIHQLESINLNIEKMWQDVEVLGAINDHHFGYIYLEQNIAENQSIGFKMNHDVSRNFDNNHLSHNNIFAISHKYQFLNYQNIVASFISKLQYSSDKLAYHSRYIDFAIAIGHSKETKHKKKYNSFAFSVRKFLHPKARKDIGIHFTINQGFEIAKNYFIDNYAEYEYIKGQRIYSSSVYLQSSLVRHFERSDAKLTDFSVQLGYFYKKSLIYKNHQLSGPFISLWLAV